jgi:hypothetical protein
MSTLTSPLWITLTPLGQTLVAVWDTPCQQMIIDAFISQMGEPQWMGPNLDNPGSIYLLFPHQNMPDKLKDTAERMTSEMLLRCLEDNIPCTNKGGNK